MFVNPAQIVSIFTVVVVCSLPFLSLAYADYYLVAPSKQYTHFMSQMTEKIYMSKVCSNESCAWSILYLYHERVSCWTTSLFFFLVAHFL